MKRDYSNIQLLLIRDEEGVIARVNPQIRDELEIAYDAVVDAKNEGRIPIEAAKEITTSLMRDYGYIPKNHLFPNPSTQSNNLPNLRMRFSDDDWRLAA